MTKAGFSKHFVMWVKIIKSKVLKDQERKKKKNIFLFLFVDTKLEKDCLFAKTFNLQKC